VPVFTHVDFQPQPFFWVNYGGQGLTIERMKTTYILGAILACSVIGTLVGARGAKTGFLVLTALLSLYGLFRLLG
jgi:hypothetical protein